MEEYFNLQTKHILDNAVAFLPNNPTMRFIWAEISYLSMWWDGASDEQKIQMKEWDILMNHKSCLKDHPRNKQLQQISLAAKLIN